MDRPDATSLVVVVGVGAAGVALLGPGSSASWRRTSRSARCRSRSGFITVVSVAYMVYQARQLAVLDHEHTGRLAVAAAIAVVVLVAGAAWLNGPAGIAGVAQPRQPPTSCSWRSRSMPHGPRTPLRFGPWLWVAGAAAAALSVAGAFLPSTGTGAVVRLALVVALGATALRSRPESCAACAVRMTTA